jgi:hypothetical protein
MSEIGFGHQSKETKWTRNKYRPADKWARQGDFGNHVPSAAETRLSGRGLSAFRDVGEKGDSEDDR